MKRIFKTDKPVKQNNNKCTQAQLSTIRYVSNTPRNKITQRRVLNHNKCSTLITWKAL